MIKQIQIKVYGHVQGVFFRDTTRKVARKLGLVGCVKNMRDGSVYIKAEGPEEDLNKLLEFAKVGPKWAHVERVEHEFIEAQGKFKGFEFGF